MSTAPVEPRALAVVPEGGSLASAAMAIRDIVEQKQLIAQVMRELMKKDEHYGVIPGTGKRRDADGNELPPKPSLYKPGADLLGVVFRLDPEYTEAECIHEPGYIYYRIRCTLTHIPTGLRVGSGMGSCNSREEKYRRAAAKKCPNCGKEAIIKGREEYGGGWLCYEKKGGCRAKFKDGDASIEQQDTGVADPSDLDNTILKMALKRARVDAILTATAASDFFTQDVEDLGIRAAAYTDVEVTPVDPKAPTAATSSASSAAAGTTTSATRATAPTASATTKPTTRKPIAGGALPANEVKAKPDDRMSVQGQWAQIETLRAKVPGWSGDYSDERHDFAQNLGRYRTHDGKRCTTPRQLTFDQASNFIKRMMGKEDLNDRRGQWRAEQAEADLGAAVGSANQQPDADEVTTMRALQSKVNGDEVLADHVCGFFGVDSLDELTYEQRTEALQRLTMDNWQTGLR